MNTSKLLAVITLTVLCAFPSRAASTVGVDDNLYNYLQLLQSNFNSDKVEVINRIMKLSAEDAKKFWSIYREYENALGKQAVNRLELITEFVQAHQDNTFDGAKAKAVAKRWFKAQRARLDLLEKYHARIQKALSPVQAGQFLQIENQIGIFIDLAIASEMPLVGQQVK